VERTELASLATRRSTAQGLAQRARIIALDLIRGWEPVFPRDKREAFARR